MLQRVGIAQALINDPELVILDEPLSGLDPIGRKDLRALITELRAQGKTIVLSSHILSDVELLADRVAILVKGKTVDTGPVHELMDAKVLSTEVVVDGPSDELVGALEQSGHEVSRIGDSVQVVVEGEAPIDPVVDLIREHEGRIRAVLPRKESLEDLVVKQARTEG
jgi:ABC-2 type transport system ATP-binding protein